jgi:hypothetical protein
MKRPSKPGDDKEESVPPGGRAAERLRQDRLARGLASPPKPSTLDLDPDTAPDAAPDAEDNAKPPGRNRQ